MTYVPDKVLLVGSVALNSAQEVMQTVGRMFGRRLDRVPDGEPGGRRHWITWQYPLLRANAYLEATGETVNPGTGFHGLRLAEGVKAAEVEFGELGYAREARASYQDFLKAREGGDIPGHARFQVCLPTPLAVVAAYCRGPDMLAIESAYEKAMIAEVAAIAAAIPHDDLTIQWDVCYEMIFWDGQLAERIPEEFPDVRQEVIGRLKRLAEAVPSDVELGIHLCYGDLDAKHFVDPRDAERMTDLANALSDAILRKLAYVHMPVPIDRVDDDFYRPLEALRLHPETVVYLGLVHNDGPGATRKRIEVASRYVPEFGIAAECGIARKRKPDLVRSILQVHAQASREPD